MKKVIVLFIIMFCFVVPRLSAQRYLPGMRGLQLTTGSVNALNLKKGFHWDIAFSQYTKRADRWVFGAGYMQKKYPYKNFIIPQSQFTVDAGYYLKFLSDPRKTFFVSIGASVMAGYETINWDKKLLPDGATIHNGDTFLFGGALTLEMEAYLTDRYVLIANIRERLLSGSSVGKLNTQFGIGIKYIIN
jgi:hypothetical protein